MAQQIFSTKIRHVQLTFSPFTAEQMSDIGGVVLDSIIRRIRTATNDTDSAAPPLATRYAEYKARQRKYPGHAQIRDWTLRGKTLRSLKVKLATEDKVVLGPIDPQSQMIIAIQNKRSHQWGVSPRDHEVMYAAIRQSLMQARAFRVVRKAA